MTETQAVLSEQDKRRAQQAGDGGEDPGRRWNKWWTLVAVCLGTFMLLLDSNLKVST